LKVPGDEGQRRDGGRHPRRHPRDQDARNADSTTTEVAAQPHLEGARPGYQPRSTREGELKAGAREIAWVRPEKYQSGRTQRSPAARSATEGNGQRRQREDQRRTTRGHGKSDQRDVGGGDRCCDQARAPAPPGKRSKRSGDQAGHESNMETGYGEQVRDPRSGERVPDISVESFGSRQRQGGDERSLVAIEPVHPANQLAPKPDRCPTKMQPDRTMPIVDLLDRSRRKPGAVPPPPHLTAHAYGSTCLDAAPCGARRSRGAQDHRQGTAPVVAHQASPVRQRWGRKAAREDLGCLAGWRCLRGRSGSRTVSCQGTGRRGHHQTGSKCEGTAG
jgi:hypothetical protein